MSEKFRTIYDRIRTVSNPGSPFINDYKLSIDDDGKEILIKSGEINVYNQIQACRESCDINMILDRYINVGDPTILNRSQTFYADVTEIPKDYAEILRLGIEADNIFNSLSVEDRAKFDNDKNMFFASIGSDKFNEVFGYKKDSEVKSDEQKSE